MLQSALASGAAERRSVFELFPRRLPPGRRYGVVAGVGRALDAIESFRFGDDEIDLLREQAVVDERTLDWLADYRFSGDIWGYPEGETYFPYSPLLVVESTFAEAVLLETVLLSIYNHDSAIASAASRMTWAAGERPCIEMGSRRTHEQAAVAAARAAYVAGFARHLQPPGPPGRTASRRAGTSAHSFTLLHDTEGDAFRAQVALARQGHHAARRHLRHRRGGARSASRSPARTSAPSGSTPATWRCSPTGCAPSSTSSARPRPAIIVTSDLDEFAIAGLVRGPGRRLRRRHPAGHRQRPPDLRLRLQAGRPRGRRRRGRRAWRRRARTRSRSAAASTPCAGAPPTGPPRPR